MASIYDIFKISSGTQEVPDYLIVALKMNGFDTPGALRSIKSEQDFIKLIEILNKTIQNVNHQDAKQKMIRSIESFYLTLDEHFTIPFGHEGLIREIIELAKKLNEPDVAGSSTDMSLPTQTHKRKNDDDTIGDKILLSAQKFLNSLTLKLDTTRPLQVVLHDNQWALSCCFCNKDLRVNIDKGINLSSFKGHVKNQHLCDNQGVLQQEKSIAVEILSQDIQGESSSIISPALPISTPESSVQSTPISSPAKKKIAIEKEDRKKALAKKLIDFRGEISPLMLDLIENAVKNSCRYDNMIKQKALYFLIRGGPHLYSVLSKNLSLPSYKTLTRFMDSYHYRLIEGKLYFDELLEFIEKRKLQKVVSVIEDATALKKLAEFDSTNEIILGLSAPFDPYTGMVHQDYYKATTAAEIAHHIRNATKSIYIFVILAKTVEYGSPTFLLGFYSCDNKFTHKEVTTRSKFIHNELFKRGIDVICFGSDGDSRFIKSQKTLLKFGNISNYKNILIAGDLNSKILGYQDPLHGVKKMNHALFDTSDVLKMGKYSATVRHLIILFKTFPKYEHGLNLSDLDPNDKMDYKRLYKITDSKVIDSLQKVEDSNGTIAFLNILKSLMIAYVKDDSSDQERLINAAYATSFLRIWAQWLIDEEISMKHFITSNAFEGIEINLILVIRLALTNKLKFIHLISSQNNEEFFRCLRSYSGMESLAVNCSVKGFISKVRRIQMEECLIADFDGDVQGIPKVLSREKKKNKMKEEDLIELEIEESINEGIEKAVQDCRNLGMECGNIDLRRILNIKGNTQIVEEDNYHNDFLGCSNEIIDNSLITEDQIIGDIIIEKVEFTNINTGNDTVIIRYDGEEQILKKTSLCFLLQEDVVKIKNNKRERFIPNKVLALKNLNSTEVIWRTNEISIGEWLVVYHDAKFLVGRALNFQRATQKTKCEKVFISDVLNMKDPKHQDVHFLLEPIYKISNSMLVTIQKMPNEQYFKISQYICHLKNSEVNIREVLGTITKFHMEKVKQ